MYKNREQQIIEKWNEVYERFKEGLEEIELINQGNYMLFLADNSNRYTTPLDFKLEVKKSSCSESEEDYFNE